MKRVGHGIERIWSKDGPAAWALTPLSWLFAVASGVRNFLYDRGIRRAVDLGVPAVSVGNLAVGGTGKTPVSAWIAAELAARGGKPAILLRGYGADEPLVHTRLNPAVPVIVNADRVAGALAAREQGATVLVLDDAFQHRRAARDLDLVLIAAEQRDAHRLLPAGPLRESRGALRRAGLIVITRKSASLAEAETAAASWSAFAGAPETVIVHLKGGDLHGATPDRESERVAASSLAGKTVLAISAIGAPAAFEAQLSAMGARVESARYGDHHDFTGAEVQGLADRAGKVDLVICTLKDAVKLGPLWPRQAPALWYLSQAVEVERGASVLREALARLV